MNRKIVGYQILKSRWLGELTTAVEGCLKDGYEPSGSLQIEEVKNTDRDGSLLSNFTQYLQPMVKYADIDPEHEKDDRVKTNSAIIMAQYISTTVWTPMVDQELAKRAVCAAIALEFQFDEIHKIGLSNKGESNF